MRRAELVELEPGEEVRASAHASFRGAAAVTVRATFALGSNRMRRRAFDAWSDATRAAGLPVVPADMIVTVTDRRVLFGRPTFLGHPPAAYWSAVELGEIAQVVTVRHGLLTGMAIAFAHGGVAELEALRGAGLRRVAHAIGKPPDR